MWEQFLGYARKDKKAAILQHHAGSWNRILVNGIAVTITGLRLYTLSLGCTLNCPVATKN
jgi:hypothetical protein